MRKKISLYYKCPSKVCNNSVIIKLKKNYYFEKQPFCSFDGFAMYKTPLPIKSFSNIIHIPFHSQMIEEILSGRKTITTRSKKYGKVGDSFYADDNRFKCDIIDIIKLPLQEICDKYYKEEGFVNPQDFKNFWLTIHRKWTPQKKFYLHKFATPIATKNTFHIPEFRTDIYDECKNRDLSTR